MFMSPLVIRLGAIALGFGVSVAYIPGWTGASISTGYLFLMFVLPMVLLFIEIPVTRFHLIGSLFLLYVCVSLSWSLNFHIAFFILLQVLLAGIVFCLGSAIKDLKAIFVGLGLGLGVSAVISILQYFSLDQDLIYTSGRYSAGLFVNPNVLCEFSAIMLVSFIVFKLWWWIPVALPGLIIIHSRAALLSLFVCLLIWLWRFKLISVMIILSGFAFIGFTSNYLNFKSTSIIERFDMWMDTIRGLSFFGHGVGSFELMFPKYAVNIDIAQHTLRHAHNDWLQLVFEFGIMALVPVVLFFQILRIKNDNQKYILYSIGIISLFSYPLHVPAIMFIGFLVAGNLTRMDDTDFNFWLSRRFVISKRIQV